jgi:hypothetical protein
MRISALAIVLAASAQAATVTYTADLTSIIANPERGYHATANPPGPGAQNVDVFETTTACWAPALNQATMTSNRVNLGITLQAVRYSLANWRTSAISQAFLDRIAADAAAARGAGVTLIVRFVYGWVGQRPDTTRAWMIAHIDQLGPVLTAQADVIAWIDAGFIGRWGEWHDSSNGLLGPYNPAAFQYGDNVTADSRAVLDRMFLQFPASRCILMRYPRQKSQYCHPSYSGDPWWDPTAMPQTAEARTAANVARHGNHNDSFLGDDFDGTYGHGAVTDTNVVNLKARVAGENRYVPQAGELDMGFASTAVNNTAANAPAILAKLSTMRWTAFNLIDGSNQSSFQAIWQTPDCIPAGSSMTGASTTLYDEAARRLGYRLRLVSATLPDSATAGQPAAFSLTVRNDGFTAPVSPRTVRLVLRSAANAEIATTLAAVDPRTWLPGADLTVPATWTLPSGLAAGTYTMFLHLAAPEASIASRPEYAIRLANTGGVWEATTGYNRVGSVTVAAANAAPQITAPATGANLVLP